MGRRSKDPLGCLLDAIRLPLIAMDMIIKIGDLFIGKKIRSTGKTFRPYIPKQLSGLDDYHDNSSNLIDADNEWSDRTLCSDESCTGTKGPDNRCRVCGKTIIDTQLTNLNEIEFKKGRAKILQKTYDLPLSTSNNAISFMFQVKCNDPPMSNQFSEKFLIQNEILGKVKSELRAMSYKRFKLWCQKWGFDDFYISSTDVEEGITLVMYEMYRSILVEDYQNEKFRETPLKRMEFYSKIQEIIKSRLANSDQ